MPVNRRDDKAELIAGTGHFARCLKPRVKGGRSRLEMVDDIAGVDAEAKPRFAVMLGIKQMVDMLILRHKSEPPVVGRANKLDRFFQRMGQMINPDNVGRACRLEASNLGCALVNIRLRLSENVVQVDIHADIWLAS